MPATANQVKASVNAIFALAESIRAAGSIPSGNLYAACMNAMDIQTYESFIERLVGARLVSRNASHLLTWVGPEIRA